MLVRGLSFYQLVRKNNGKSTGTGTGTGTGEKTIFHVRVRNGYGCVPPKWVRIKELVRDTLRSGSTVTGTGLN